jgi:hypothetical protein
LSDIEKELQSIKKKVEKKSDAKQSSELNFWKIAHCEFLSWLFLRYCDKNQLNI